MDALLLPTSPDQPHSDAVEFRDELQGEKRSERSWRVAELQRALLASSRQDGDRTSVHDPALEAMGNLRERFPLTAHQSDDELALMQPPSHGNPAVTKQQPEQQAYQNWVSDDRFGGKPNKPRRRAPAVRPDGVLSEGRDGSFWRTKKRPQLLMMAQIVGDLLRTHPEYESRPLHLLDIGGAKGHLAQHLAEKFGPRVNVTVVDIDASRIRSGSMRATRRGNLANLRFVAGDASDRRAAVHSSTDIVVGLHACGGLSDFIMAHALVNRAAFAVCTCCFLSNPRLQIPSPSTTDSDGSTVVTRDEWLSWAEDVPASHLRSAMKSAELQHDPERSALGAHSLNAIRAAAMEHYWAERCGKPIERPASPSNQSIHRATLSLWGPRGEGARADGFAVQESSNMGGFARGAREASPPRHPAAAATAAAVAAEAYGWYAGSPCTGRSVASCPRLETPPTARDLAKSVTYHVAIRKTRNTY